MNYLNDKSVLYFDCCSIYIITIKWKNLNLIYVIKPYEREWKLIFWNKSIFGIPVSLKPCGMSDILKDKTDAI